jgi:shikimate kinase
VKKADPSRLERMRSAPFPAISMSNPDRFQREHPHLYLCGMPGSGKSTLARGLSTCLERPFIDLDRLIEEREGASVADLFSAGEAGFRLAERQALDSTFDMPPSVIALGGGALQDTGLTQMVLRHGLMVHLDVPLEVLVRRPAIRGDRPLLAAFSGRDLMDRLSGMLTDRESRYRMADLSLRIDADEDADRTIGRIVAWLDGMAAQERSFLADAAYDLSDPHAPQTTNPGAE